VKREGRGLLLLVFLVGENKTMLLTKKLLKSGTVKEVVNGLDGRRLFPRPRYWFVDPKEHLKGYGIAEYLKLVQLDGNNAGNQRNSI
jgi:hypothetical protein